MATNGSEFEARQRKVFTYAAHFYTAQIHSSSVALMGLQHPAWCQLAKALRIQPPHSEATINGILQCLQAFEAARQQQEAEQGNAPVDLAGLTFGS